jgi:hypothetical protein
MSNIRRELNDVKNKYGKDIPVDLVDSEHFIEYKRVQNSGACNMYLISEVVNRSGLSVEVILSIQQNYDSISDKFDTIEEVEISCDNCCGCGCDDNGVDDCPECLGYGYIIN